MAEKVSFIGSGNLATSLAYNFDIAGYEIYQVISRNESNAKELASKYGGFHSSKISELFSDAKVVFVCVNDDQINEVANEIPSSFGGYVCHTSGAKPIDELKGCRSPHGVFYPLQSFTKANPISMMPVPLMVEGESIMVENDLEEMADKISNKVRRVNSDDRKRYHLSAVFANNFSNLMFVLAKNYLENNNLDFEFLRPIIQETAARMKSGNPENWQTGPARRKDVETINEHLSMLNDKDLETVYSTLSNLIMTKL